MPVYNITVYERNPVCTGAEFYPDFHWVAEALWWTVASGSAVKYIVPRGIGCPGSRVLEFQCLRISISQITRMTLGTRFGQPWERSLGNPRELWEDKSRQNVNMVDRWSCFRLLRWVSFDIYSVAAQRRCHQSQEFIMGWNSDENLPDPR